jgi:hypothetical protein
VNKIILTLLFLLTSFSCLAHGHLVFQSKDIHAHLDWVKGPLVGDESVLKIDFKNGEDHSVLDFKDKLDVKLWMPAMGHGSATTIIAPFKDANGAVVVGSYLISNIYFVMDGAWQILFTISDKDGMNETQTFDVDTGSSDEGHHH